MTSRPAADELEVTLLGPGVGECVVVHVGDGRWIIVDSYDDDGVPAAQRYLDGLGVGRDEVDVVLVTHVHRDHYEGIGRLHDYYRQAALQYPSALVTRTFARLWQINADGDILGGLPTAIEVATKRRLTSGRPARRKLQADSGVLTHGGVRIRALSPSDAAVTQSDDDLATVLAAADRLAIVGHLKNQNHTSVVLHIDAGYCAALLGSDLEVSPRTHGWHAIVDNPDFADLACGSLLKVPHHGSDNADADVTWDHLLTPSPHLLVAPFWPSELPRSNRDVPRLRSRGHCLWPTAPSGKWVTRPDGAQFSLPRVTGRVTARRSPRDADWRITRVPPALPPWPPLGTAPTTAASPAQHPGLPNCAIGEPS